MTFASIYPHYVAKVEKKGHSIEQLDQIIQWLTGFDKPTINSHIARKTTFEQFFDEATLNPHAHLITGIICGYRVEEIENELTRNCRYLDKLIDELARGKKFYNILRTPKTP